MSRMRVVDRLTQRSGDEPRWSNGQTAETFPGRLTHGRAPDPDSRSVDLAVLRALGLVAIRPLTRPAPTLTIRWCASVSVLPGPVRPMSQSIAGVRMSTGLTGAARTDWYADW